MELANERAAEKDNYGENEIPNLLSSSHDHLHRIVVNVGGELGGNFDMIDHNINLIKSVEQVRVDLRVSTNNKTNSNSTSIQEVSPVIETGEHSLEELIGDDDNSEQGEEEEDWDHLRKMFSRKKDRNKNRSPRNFGRKSIVGIKRLEQSVKKKKDERCLLEYERVWR